MNLLSAVFETSVSRQQNYAKCRYGDEPGLLNVQVQGNLLWAILEILISVLFQLLTVQLLELSVSTLLFVKPTGLLQYIIIPWNKRTFGYAATSIPWHQNIGSHISLKIWQKQMYQPQRSMTILEVNHTLIYRYRKACKMDCKQVKM